MPVTRTAAPTATVDFPTGVFAYCSRTWQFKTDGTGFWSGPTFSDEGTYRVTGDQVVLKGGFCGDAEGHYTWAYDGAVLSFKVLRDSCADQRAEVDRSKWKKKP
jgi:hypothetical protein